MDMQRTTYAADAMALLERLREPLYAKVVDCALGILDPSTPRCLDLEALDARFGGAGPAPAAAIYDYIKVSDVKANNVAGGGFTNGAWRTRDINTEDSDVGNHIVVAGNQMTIQPGNYITLILAPAFAVDEHKVRFQNITDGATEILGENAHASSGSLVGTHSFVLGRFTIAAAKAFEVQHRCAATRAGNGFGAPTNFGVNEIYTVAEFWREPD